MTRHSLYCLPNGSRADIQRLRANNEYNIKSNNRNIIGYGKDNL